MTMPPKCPYCGGKVLDAGDWLDHADCKAAASKARHDETNADDYPEPRNLP